MDCIHIKDLEVWANHGVFPEETKLGQKFLVSVDLYTDIRRAGLEDNLEQSINYGTVSHRVKRFMEEHTYKLIETVVERLAACLLREFPVEKVHIELKKPWAPIGLPLETVSIEAERSWHRVFIALGSNLGDSRANLDFAVRQLSEIAGCKVKKVSEYIVTKPYGYTDQPDFVNGALELKTLYTPKELLDILHSIEAAAQRERIIRWGPRTLDLDILFYDDLVMDDEELIIPHIEIALRDFVLKPLNEIAPGFIHPVYHKTVRDLYLEY
ncbi:MAG: 2-amino-4-hydroxy-6-hydroxymethyldihydropteridine diphosphokinase, partial [Eubacteriales bacterium]|nr:2-amino-4-hydroxy-6-hydroxymethyldihydropteridine diphosphokinase [Eubacteriales bacterium]